MKHNISASAFVAFLKGNFISLMHWRQGKRRELLHEELFFGSRSFCQCREWHSPLEKEIQSRSALVSYEIFVRDNTGNLTKLVKFGVSPQISFINKARIQECFSM